MPYNEMKNETEVGNIYNITNNFISAQQANIADGNSTINVVQNNFSSEANNDEEEEHAWLMESAKSIQEYFVETTPYREAIDVLKKDNIVLLTGNSGTGKSDTSIMLASKFAPEYQIKIIEGVDIGGSNEIKEIIASIRKNYTKKEVIIFDDFLGKTMLNEDTLYLSTLEDVFKQFKRNGNKKIILNSRNTIVESANAINSSIADFLKHGISNIDLNKLDNNSEKCDILLKHIVKYDIVDNIQTFLSNEKELTIIIEHPNFTPMNIDWAIRECRELKPDEYIQTILKLLNNPEGMWKKELKALNSYSSDYLKILYSLSDTYIKEDIVNESFLYYMDKSNLDYNEALQSTIERLVTLIKHDNYGKVTFKHPSIIDTLQKFISEKERKDIISGALYIEQIERFDTKKEYLRKMLNSIEVFNLKALPITYINSSLEFPNIILIKYLEYVIKWRMEIDESLMVTIIDNVFQYGRLVLLHSADLIINVLSLNYDFSPIFNNDDYMKELYSCSDYENIWKLLDLTEKKDNGKVDYEQVTDYIKSEIVDKLSDFASDKVNEYIESVFHEYTVEFFDDYDDESEEAYDDIAEDIVNNILDDRDIADITDQVREDICSKNLINYDACLSAEYEINIDYDSFSTKVQEYWENN